MEARTIRQPADLGAENSDLRIEVVPGPTFGRCCLIVAAPRCLAAERQRLIDVLHLAVHYELERSGELAVFHSVDGAVIDLSHEACARALLGFVTSPFADTYRSGSKGSPSLDVEPGPLTPEYLDVLWPSVARHAWDRQLLGRLSPVVALQPDDDGVPLHIRLVGESEGTCIIRPKFIWGSGHYLRSLGIVAALARQLQIAEAITEEEQRLLCVGDVQGLVPAIRVRTDRLRRTWAYFMHSEVLRAYEARYFHIEATGVELPASLTGEPPARPSGVPELSDISEWRKLA